LRSMRSRQLTFVFADSPQGGKEVEPSDESVGKAHLLRIAKGMPTSDLSAPATETDQLLKRVASPWNLAEALLNVARNKGAPGVDGRSVAEVLEDVQRLLPKLRRALLDGSYQPGDIRRVWIPKPGGRSKRTRNSQCD
jgi:RNA-directed DNA polymerase